MTGLGSTSDARDLVPGSVATLADLVWGLRGYGEALIAAGDGLARIDTENGWQGPAADSFRDAYRAQPRRWREAGDCFVSAAAALDRYASTLSWAQARASEAIALYDLGDSQTARARANHDSLRAGRGGVPRAAFIPAFYDPGEANREAARDLLRHAQNQLQESGEREERAVAAVRDLAPEEPTFWVSAGSAAGDAGSWLLDKAQDAGVAVVNGLSSFGNAMLHNPGDVATLLGGLMLMGVSGLGEAGGLLLDATGAGAIARVPLNVLAAAGLVTGATLAAAGAVNLSTHASSDCRVEPMEAQAEAPRSGSGGRQGTKTDRCKEHLTDRDLDAARRELDGEVVATKSDGTPWDHVGEVRDAQRGLVNRIDQLKRILADSRISPDARGAAQSELSEASRLLDYSRQFVPPAP